MIRTKIIATMGPACGDVPTLLSLFRHGVDICRMNFSHGSFESHLEMLGNIRQAAARHDQPIAILGDLCGPKIRLGIIAEQNGTGGMPIDVGDELVIQRSTVVGAARRVSSIYAQFVDDVKVGHRILVEDGLLRFLCTDKNADELFCQCTMGGVLKSSKGVNLPDTAVKVPSITERDWECADWAIEHDLDYLALSFVRSAADLHQLRQHLRKKKSDIHIIAKIEKPQALAQIDAILEASDGLMIARGDLGVEMDVAQVPIIQKDLVRRCQLAGKPVIVATQMLQSMIEQASPTRAEVSDVANAIFDGTDVVMLSGETSVGKFPVGAVHIMNHVAEVTEEYLSSIPAVQMGSLKQVDVNLRFSASLVRGVWQMVHDLKVKLVVIWSQTGATARIFSKHRFPTPIIALSSDHRALRRMQIHYGVAPYEMAFPSGMKGMMESIEQLVRSHKFADLGDQIVVVTGASLGTPGINNSVVIHKLGDTWSEDKPSGGFPGAALKAGATI